jgi:hypothetical protein
MAEPLKKYNTIGCCGIDCGLCPRFNSKSDSACPGCGGANFKEKHPSCAFVTCCVIKRGYEVCSECKDYPCSRFDPEKEGYDSFVTHKKVFYNLDFIKNHHIGCFLEQQKLRMNILADFLTNYDDGRSKSLFCIACTLLPLDILSEIKMYTDTLDESLDMKEKNRGLKNKIMMAAADLKIELKLNTKKKSKST